MYNVMFGLLIWLAVGAVIAERYGASIGAARRLQLDDFLEIRRDEWFKGVGVRS